MIRIKKYYVVLTSIFVFIIYLFTLAPSVVQIDSGELAAVQATLGIAHPTGYPLFTMIGYLFSLIPLPFSIIFWFSERKIYQKNQLRKRRRKAKSSQQKNKLKFRKISS
ncbi:MAG: DUF2723 domain-containing protein [Ignavibacteria bacterium CHB3]|nr:DUF2723 domain-containing protein [Ignavibacteria bacterium CHB3]